MHFSQKDDFVMYFEYAMYSVKHFYVQFTSFNFSAVLFNASVYGLLNHAVTQVMYVTHIS